MKKAISCFIRISKIKLLCVSPERKTHRRTHKTVYTVGRGGFRKSKPSDGGESPQFPIHISTFFRIYFACFISPELRSGNLAE